MPLRRLPETALRLFCGFRRTRPGKRNLSIAPARIKDKSQRTCGASLTSARRYAFLVTKPGRAEGSVGLAQGRGSAGARCCSLRALVLRGWCALAAVFAWGLLFVKNVVSTAQNENTNLGGG